MVSALTRLVFFFFFFGCFPCVGHLFNRSIGEGGGTSVSQLLYLVGFDQQRVSKTCSFELFVAPVTQAR
jgi:hypothetical protein